MFTTSFLGNRTPHSAVGMQSPYNMLHEGDSHLPQEGTLPAGASMKGIPEGGILQGGVLSREGSSLPGRLFVIRTVPKTRGGITAINAVVYSMNSGNQ